MSTNNMSTSYRCRGLRKWCSRRCEATTQVEPQGYPVIGFYCSLHSYQKPRGNADGTFTFDEPIIEEHVRRKTSFVSVEQSVVQELLKAPGLVRDRPGAPSSATAQAVLSWLMDRRQLDEPSAMAFAQQIVNTGLIVPMDGSKKFTVDKNALVKVQLSAPRANWNTAINLVKTSLKKLAV
jgi:hypothetical protein